MPLYDLKCNGCGSIFEVLCDPDARKDQPCPTCEKAGCQAVPSLPRRERHFYGTTARSLMYGFYGEGEVPQARRAFADTGARINDDGSVEFDRRSTQEKFTKRWGEIKGQTKAPSGFGGPTSKRKK